MADDLHQQLQQHATALRGLARDLLRCDHTADDVAQATLQQALAQRDLQPGPLGGWLQRTLVNFVRQWRRGERRRLVRETSVATREPVPAVADQLARREVLQRVTDAVLLLDEPYQTAVFLRYFEDLPPRTIARRTQTNVATVKSRLSRGLVMLRARLDRGDQDSRSWRPALLVAFGLPSSLLVPLPIGALFVSATPKVIVAVGAACVGGWFFFAPADPVLPSHGSASEGRAADPATPASAAVPKDATAGERTAATPDATAIDALAHPYMLELQLLVLDPLGLPVAGYTPLLGPVGCARNEADAATGPDGRVTLRWPARQPQVTIDLADPRGQVRRVKLRHDAPAKLALLGERKGPGMVVRLDSSGGGTRPAEVVLGGARLELSNAESFLRAKASGRPTMHEGLHPAARFGDDSARLVEDATAAREFAVSTQGIRLDGSRFAFTVAGEAKTPAAADMRAIAGTVFGSDGKPAAKLPIALLGSGPQPLAQQQTGDDGTFRFEGIDAGEFTVRAGGDARGLATAPATTTQGTTPITLHLQLGSCVRGKALDPKGAPLAKALVEWRALDNSFVDQTEVGDDGAFVFANLPAGPGQVLLLPADGARRLPLAMAPSVLPDSEGIELRGDPNGPGAIVVEPLHGSEGQRPQIRVVHADTGLVVGMQPPNKKAQWSMVGLAAGFYDVELRLPGGGVRALGRHWCDGNGPVDLGRVELPRPGEVQFAAIAELLPADEAQRTFEIVALRSDLDVRAELAPVPLDKPVQLPAGDYVLLFRHRDGGVHTQRFTVRAGERSDVRLGG